MIPKIIHYCWFGGNPLPKSAKKCIASWKKYCPDYEIREWNESNYDVRKIPYISQAYDAKKYAFVSDSARFDILYQHGGVYFDTDVEVIRPLDDILERGAFMGCERDGSFSIENERICEDCKAVLTNPGLGIAAAPGLGIAAAPGLGLYREILAFYNEQNFLLPNGGYNMKTVVEYTTSVLIKHGLKDIKGIQQIDGITIYPKEYFNPFDNGTGKLTITDHTYSIHWYSKSWMDKKTVFISRMARPIHRIFGNDSLKWIKRLMKI